MRWKWLGAAAAMLLGCAGQAQAARYYEFQITGLTVVPYFTGPTPQAFYVSDSVLVAFDTQAMPGFNYAQGDGYAIVLGLDGTISTLNQPYGPYFNLSFSPAAVATGQTLQPLQASGAYGYMGCYRNFCQKYDGVLTGFAARTSDVAPAKLGITETALFTPVPEPAAWTMMILGVGAVGGAMRRRRRLAFA